MSPEEIQKQLERLELAHQVIREIIERIEFRISEGLGTEDDDARLAAHRWVLVDLAQGIKIGKHEINKT